MTNPAIKADGLSKHFGRVKAVDDVSFEVRSGAITGFLGRNGAGKTTTLRMIVGLAHQNSGKVTIRGESYKDIDTPWCKVGTVLDAEAFHPGRTGRNHLRWVAAANSLPSSRVDAVLKEVDLESVAHRRVKGYSLGMRQRLALATALLGDPDILILDEPANGLDPQGMHWLRDLLVGKAKAGKTILLSSHVLSELAQFVDDIIIIEKGKIVKMGPMQELIQSSGEVVKVRTPDPDRLSFALNEKGAKVQRVSPNELIVTGLKIEEVGDIALSAQAVLHFLVKESDSLEDTFLKLTTKQDKA